MTPSDKAPPSGPAPRDPPPAASLEDHRPPSSPPVRRVVVTRDEEPVDGRLGRALRSLGLPVLHWPTTAILPPEDPTELEALRETASSYDWVVFTSRNGVEAVAEVVGSAPEGVAVAVVGDKTAEAARAAGWTPTLVGEGTGEELGRALLSRLDGPVRILLPTTSRAPDTLPTLLRGAGHRVDRIAAYRTGLAGPDPAVCRDPIEGGEVGVVTFTSPSAVDGLVRALPADLLERLVRTSRAVAIGPTTAEAVAAAGWSPVQARDTSLEGVAARAAELLGLAPR